MASLGTKEVGADQVLGPEFLVSFIVLSFSIDIIFNNVSSVIKKWEQMSVKIG